MPNSWFWIPGSPGISQMSLCCVLQPPTTLRCELGWSSDPPTRAPPGASRWSWRQNANGLCWTRWDGKNRTRGVSLPARHLSHKILLITFFSKPPFSPGNWNKTLANLLRKPLSSGQGDGVSHQLVIAAGVPWSWFGEVYWCQAEVDTHSSFFPYVWTPVRPPAKHFEPWEGAVIHSVRYTCSRARFTSHVPGP